MNSFSITGVGNSWLNVFVSYKDSHLDLSAIYFFCVIYLFEPTTLILEQGNAMSFDDLI